MAIQTFPSVWDNGRDEMKGDIQYKRNDIILNENLLLEWYKIGITFLSPEKGKLY